MNLLDLIDSILIDWTSPRVRRLIHTTLLIFTIILTLFLTADGNWEDGLIALIAAFYTASNRSNTPSVTLPAGYDQPEFPETDVSY